MEEINHYLKDEEKIYLENDEHVLWTTSKLKRNKLRGFWILTNLRWIQNTHFGLQKACDFLKSPFAELATLFPMKHGTFFINLKEIKFLFKQEDWNLYRKKTGTYIGYILNEFIEEWDDEYLLCFGVTLEESAFINLFNELKNVFSIGPVIEHKDYELYPVTLR